MTWAFVAVSVVLAAVGATSATRVNEALKTPAVICGVHTRINPKTLAALRASKAFACGPVATGRPKALKPRRIKIALHSVAPATIAARLHLPAEPHIVIHASMAPAAPIVTSVNTAGWNALGTWINDTGPKPVVMAGLSIVIQGKNLVGAANAISNGAPYATITFAGCPGANGTHINISSYDGTRIVGNVGQPLNAGEAPNQTLPASLVVQTSSGKSQSYAVTWVPPLEQEQVEMSVLFIPYVSYLTGDAYEAWLGAANTQLANEGSRSSAFPAYIGGMGGKGDDVVGTNVRLLNSWKLVNTQIISVEDNDGVPNTNTDETSRGARIEQTGTGGGLTTDVHWWYDADHLISYNVLWTLEGPMGYRALPQEPMQGGICEK